MKLILDADSLELTVTFTKGRTAKQRIAGKIYTPKDIIASREYDIIEIPCSFEQMLVIKDAVINYLGPIEDRDGFTMKQDIEITGNVSMKPNKYMKKLLRKK